MNVIELFAGCGGAAQGLHAAGFNHRALVEIDADACATMRLNNLGPVVEGDVRDLDAIDQIVSISAAQAWNAAGDRLLATPIEGDEWMIERSRLAEEIQEKHRQVGLMWSSWPCQPFSLAGRRKGASDSDRNGWPWTIDAIDRFKPRWFVGENVRGMLCHSSEGHPDPYQCPACYMQAIVMPQLRARFEHAGFWLLDAASFGVPQHRRRLVVWAGPAPLQPPRATHIDRRGISQVGLFGPQLKPFLSMGKALNLQGAKKWLDRPAPTVTTTEVKGSRGAGMNGGPDRASDALFLATRPSPTITTTDGQGLGGAVSRSVAKAIVGRNRLTIAECATLQGFPDGFADRMQGNLASRYRQIGNAVPPKLAEVVGRQVLDADARLAVTV